MQHSAPSSEADRNSRKVIGAIAIFFGAILMTVGISAGPVSGEEPVPTQTVPLNNTEAPTENTPECPNSIDDFWHFVIAGGQGYSFVSITLNLAGVPVTFTGSDIILNPNNQKPDNVYVKVPDGNSFDDLIKEGSYAAITPEGGSVQFVLSHFCDGPGRPTTTTTTTTVPETTTTTTTVPETTTTTTTTTVPETTTTTTTTTVPETTTTTTTVPETTTTTTTTVPEETTTTTVPEGTTTTTVPDVTTTTVDSSSGTTTTAPTTSVAIQGPTTTQAASAGATTSIVTELPQTGSDLNRSLSVLGAMLVVVGGVLLLTARRTAN